MCSLNFMAVRALHALTSPVGGLHSISTPGLFMKPRFWSIRTYSADKTAIKTQLDVYYGDGTVQDQRPGEFDESEDREPSPPRSEASVASSPVRTSSSASVIRRLRQLSMTDVSNLEPPSHPNHNNQFDPRILKMVKARNRVKGGKRSFSNDNFAEDDEDQFGDLPNDASSYKFLKRHNIRTTFADKKSIPYRKSQNTDVDDDRYD